MTGLRSLLKQLRPFVRRTGWDVVRFPGANPDYLRGQFLAARAVDCVVDVGANVGQYGHRLRDGGYRGRILSFEPMSQEYDSLARAAAADDHWDTIHSALGANSGELEINVSGNSISSSVLPMLDRHAGVAPKSVYVDRQTVPVARLDVAASAAVDRASAPFLKVDTQGYEATVLDGAERIIGRFVGIELEMSLVPLYEGQMLAFETMHRLEGLGFRLAAISPGLIDADTGETLQADGIFARNDG